jgi:hypothetical protein
MMCKKKPGLNQEKITATLRSYQEYAQIATKASDQGERIRITKSKMFLPRLPRRPRHGPASLIKAILIWTSLKD